ncbi:MAG: lmo0937 family membrane protein [Chloroflexota bacterium]
MLWTIIGILLVLWVLGLVAHIGGALIHILLVVAVVAFIYNLVTRRSGSV